MRTLTMAAAAAVALAWSSHAIAGSEEVCSSAHVRAQVLRRDSPQKLLERRAALRSCASASCPRSIGDACSGWLKDVDAQVPTILIHVDGRAEGAESSVLVDGTPQRIEQPIEVDPGEHIIRASLTGKSETKTIVVQTGDRERPVRFATSSVDTPGPTPMHGVPTAAWVSFGVGAVGFATFIVSAITAFVTDHSLAEKCRAPDHGCFPSAKAQPEIDLLKMSRIFAGVGAGIAVLGASAGIVFILSDRHEAPAGVTRASARLGADGIRWSIEWR